VYERADAIDPVGAGLCIYSNGAMVLNMLGLEARMAELSPVMSAVSFSTQDGELLSRIECQPLVDATGQRPYPILRAGLQGALLDELGSDVVTLGAEFESLTQTPDGVEAHFKNGVAATGDLLVGADGIRSGVRRSVVDRTPEIRYVSTDWEGLMPQDPAFGPTDEFVFYVGEGKRAAALPISHELSYWFFDFQPTEARAGGGAPGLEPREQLRALFGDWCEPVRHLVETVDLSTAMTRDICDLEPLDRLVNGRVALVGDAGHATSPYLGQGASQAAESGIVLSRYLQTTTVSVEDALQRYERERMARVHAVIAGSRAMAEMAVTTDPGSAERYYESIRNGGRQFVESAELLAATGPLGYPQQAVTAWRD
jgi:FAD-dependent urate hydroxylase